MLTLVTRGIMFEYEDVGWVFVYHRCVRSVC